MNFVTQSLCGGLNPTPETRQLGTPRFCRHSRGHRKRGIPSFHAKLDNPSGTKDTVRRRRHPYPSFWPVAEVKPRSRSRGVADAGLEVGHGPKDNGTGRSLSCLTIFIKRELWIRPGGTLRPRPPAAPDVAATPRPPRSPPAPDKPAPNATVADYR